MNLEPFNSIIETLRLPGIGIAIGISLVAIVSLIQIRLMTRGLKKSIRIAVIGTSRAGKTSLITTLFDHIMSGKLARYASVSGLETIERITAYQRLMSSGLNIGPTTDKDVFAYRYTTTRKLLGFINEKVDVEIADFPGEYTVELGAGIENWQNSVQLYKKEFFSWIVRADKYIFVVDIEPLILERPIKNGVELTDSNYPKSIEILFKNAILQLKQELLDENVYERPALLVFSKFDLVLLGEKELESIYVDGGQPLRLNDHRIVQANAAIKDMADFRVASEKIMKDFNGLIEFIKNNFRSTEIIVHSSYFSDGPFRESSENVVKFSTPF